MARPLSSPSVRVLSAAAVLSLVAAGLLTTTAGSAVARVQIAAPAAVPSRFVAVPVPARTSFDLALSPRGGTAALNSFVTAVSTPGSRDYRDFLSSSQFASRFGAPRSEVRAVTNYLRAHGLSVHPRMTSRLVLSVSGSSDEVASALATRLRAVRVGGQVTTLLATPATLPSDLAAHVVGMAGLTSWASPHTMLVTSSDRTPHTTSASAPSPRLTGSHQVAQPSDCVGADNVAYDDPGEYTAQDEATQYGLNTEWSNGINASGETIGVYELAAFSNVDVDAYFGCYGLSPTITRVNVDGGPTAGDNNVRGAISEADLDVEEAGALAPGAHLVVYQGTQSGQGPFDVYAEIASADVASVVTTSWGECELALEGTTVDYDHDAATSIFTAESEVFSEMAAQGQTLVAASGDSGSSDCYGGSPDGNVRSAEVDDPASQPDVTGVGGLSVALTSPQEPSSPDEEVWNNGDGAGGGGESTQWSQPTWQPGTSWPTADRRMVPDLSAMADPNDGLIYFYGGWSSVGGTSIASPIITSLVATAEQACGTRMGLINPTLYAMEADHTGFIDVTEGTNDLLGLKSQGRTEYAAGTGYDMASGLGSPSPTTFMSGLCTQVASPALSTIDFSTGAGAASVTSGTVVTVTLLTASGEPIPFASPVVTATQTGGSPTLSTNSTMTDASGQISYSLDTENPGTVDVSVSLGATTVGSAEVDFVSPVSTSPTSFGSLPLGTDRPVTATAGSTTVTIGTSTHDQLLEMTSSATTIANYSTRLKLGRVEGSPALACTGAVCVAAFDVAGSLDVIKDVNVPAHAQLISVARQTPLATKLRASSISVVAGAGLHYIDVAAILSDGDVVVLELKPGATAFTGLDVTEIDDLYPASGGSALVCPGSHTCDVAALVRGDLWLARVTTSASVVDVSAQLGYSSATAGVLEGTPVMTADPGEGQALEILEPASHGLVEFAATADSPTSVTSEQVVAGSAVTEAAFEPVPGDQPDDVLYRAGGSTFLAVRLDGWTSLALSSELDGLGSPVTGIGAGSAPLLLTSAGDYSIRA